MHKTRVWPVTVTFRAKAALLLEATSAPEAIRQVYQGRFNSVALRLGVIEEIEDVTAGPMVGTAPMGREMDHAVQLPLPFPEEDV
jgi:hypothetical protein